jgi:hypothetical protein
VSRVEGVVRFGASGDLSLNVNIIAVGISNWGVFFVSLLHKMQS